MNECLLAATKEKGGSRQGGGGGGGGSAADGGFRLPDITSNSARPLKRRLRHYTVARTAQ